MLGITRQSYYKHQKACQARQRLAKEVLHLVQSIRILLPKLGGRKLYHLLQHQLKALKVGRDKLFTILKANGLLIKRKRSYHKTTNSYHRFKKHKNLIKSVAIERPEQVLVADITYVGTRQEPLYLALITDAYSKKIMGYNVSNSLAEGGAIAALKMAIKARTNSQKTLIHHSDRGVQYCGDAYQKKLSKATIACSMTEQYDPYENAIAERVNGILKQELLPSNKSLAAVGYKNAKTIIKQAIRIYNQQRPHWSCWMNTPQQMHQQELLKRREYKNRSLLLTKDS